MTRPLRMKAILVVIFVTVLISLGCTYSKSSGGPSSSGAPPRKRGAASKLTAEENLFKPLPVAPKTAGKNYNWAYETLSGDTVVLDEVWQVSPVLLAFFDYGVADSHEAFRQAFLVDAEFGTVIRVVGLNLYDEGKKMDDDELAGRLSELVTRYRYREGLKGIFGYAEMLGMAIVQLQRGDALHKTFGGGEIGTATLVGIGGKVVYGGLRGRDIYAKSVEYLKGLYESQKYRVADYGNAPMLKDIPGRKAIWVVWMPDSLPSLEALKTLNSVPDAAEGWELALMTLVPKNRAEEALQRIGGRVARQRVIQVSFENLRLIFGTDDLFLPALAVVGEDGHLWYLGNGEWTAEDLRRILTNVSAKASG